MGDAPALEVSGLVKSFGSIPVLQGVDLRVGSGEIHALIGQNGSGKSTLVKAVTGYHRRDRGTIRVRDRDLPNHPFIYRDYGIAVIHQDLGLFGEATVTENLGLVAGYGTTGLRRVDWAREHDSAARLLADFGVDVDPRAVVGTLNPGEQAIIALLRAVRGMQRGQGPPGAGRASSPSPNGGEPGGLFILDEPTAYLGGREADQVLTAMRGVADSGSGVLFISHRLREVLSVADRVTVLRDGQVVMTRPAAETDSAELAQALFGRRLESYFPARPSRPRGQAILRATGLSGLRVRDVSLTVHRHEVLGLTGLTGMGHSEVLKLLAGVQPRSAGEVTLDDRRLTKFGPRQALREGIVLVPGDRRGGIWTEGSAAANVTLPNLGDYFRKLFLQPALEEEMATRLMEQTGVAPLDPRLALASFSGGNQQKIVLSKWMQFRPRVLLLDDPTQGVDAAARHSILALIMKEAERGAGVVLLSSDYEEIAAVCSRALVIFDGVIADEIAGDDLTADRLFLAAQGKVAAP